MFVKMQLCVWFVFVCETEGETDRCFLSSGRNFVDLISFAVVTMVLTPSSAAQLTLDILLQAHHLRCLNDFIEAQIKFFAQCQQYMSDLQRQLGR